MRINRKAVGLVAASVTCLALSLVSPAADAASKSSTRKPGAVQMQCRKTPQSVGKPDTIGAIVQQGAPAPDFTATRLDCGKTSMKELANGHVTFINFFASWCHYCILEAPDLVSFYNQNHAKGLNGIGVDTADDGPPAGNPGFFYSKYHFPFVSVWDIPNPEAGGVTQDDPIWTAYATQPAVACIPTTIWLHKDGTISSAFVGQMTKADMLQQYAWAKLPQSQLQTDPSYLAQQAKSSKCLG